MLVAFGMLLTVIILFSIILCITGIIAWCSGEDLGPIILLIGIINLIGLFSCWSVTHNALVGRAIQYKVGYYQNSTKFGLQFYFNGEEEMEKK